jgi:Chorismate mutase type I
MNDTTADARPRGHPPARPLGGDVVAVHAIRGAIQVHTDTREEILKGSAELITAVLERNDLTGDDIISILFTPHRTSPPSSPPTPPGCSASPTCP